MRNHDPPVNACRERGGPPLVRATFLAARALTGIGEVRFSEDNHDDARPHLERLEQAGYVPIVCDPPIGNQPS